MWYKHLRPLLVWRVIATHRYAGHFNHGVDGACSLWRCEFDSVLMCERPYFLIQGMHSKKIHKSKVSTLAYF